MHSVYHAKITVSTKNFPRSEGRKCGVPVSPLGIDSGQYPCRKNVLFLRWRGERYILHRATGTSFFTEPPDFHIFYILRPPLEGRALLRYIPKNVFFLRDE